ncbi:competence protein ComK [Oceanobacillus chungangensis]|uniref:Competence protein n=1 Tax=Oceanobacillus chungangensis TaxID=1229152 RepID=A0A3D8PX15_9BACI|nr:competence protein ComK [Oceanobacillus chungangensis]RDW20574.1 competence protein [Oceanobacillus chungangensis]
MQNVYLISQKTKAFLTDDSSYYRTVVIEGNSEQYSKYKPEQIIDNSCLIHGSTLEGRRGAVKEILKSMSKLPVPIAPMKGIYMFPTASTKNKDCVWLAFSHIKEYFLHDNRTYIAFHDGTGIYVNVSLSTIDSQYKRTSQVIVQLNRSILFGNGQIRLWQGED